VHTSIGYPFASYFCFSFECIHYLNWGQVVTEFGAVNLFGKPVKERMKALVSIAHPLHRPWLEKEIDRGYWLDTDENSPKIPQSAHVEE